MDTGEAITITALVIGIIATVVALLVAITHLLNGRNDGS